MSLLSPIIDSLLCLLTYGLSVTFVDSCALKIPLKIPLTIPMSIPWDKVLSALTLILEFIAAVWDVIQMTWTM